ncbi:MAG: hypothetical protein K9J37_23370 [Saprospiraceae bacterium]|nr:hypothetical protein [Saprospiraceae bacterium]MCF8252866.1 hypothetical protein [Saprospiraceae bacterium]MCF8283317.1 hypothetical protein [Bacteroidales bacterium]MCF8314418.1 hypothetical protein [Saprospiraceae bacterium]MCF8443308.1 hypothetical protein [Saprospiraceae bacterium]
MKNAIVICFLLAATTGFAQKDQTMFSDVDRIGGWGAPLFEYTNLNKDVNVVSGGGGALVLNDFYLGGYGMGNATYTNQNISFDESVKFKHGGFWIGYTPLQHRVVHPYASVKLGWGKANYKQVDNLTNTEFAKQKSNIFVTTPEAGLEVNVFSFFRIAATASYRWVNGFDPVGGFKEDDLSSFGATLTLRFGGFGDDDWNNN